MGDEGKAVGSVTWPTALLFEPNSSARTSNAKGTSIPHNRLLLASLASSTGDVAPQKSEGAGRDAGSRIRLGKITLTPPEEPRLSEKHEPVSDIDTAAADSLKVLDPKRPIREADIGGLQLDIRFVSVGPSTPAMPGHCPAIECEAASGITPNSTDDGERGSRLHADCAT
jgi:hypothetical protein